MDDPNMYAYGDHYPDDSDQPLPLPPEGHPLYALPPDLAEYLLRHLQQERAALDGFLRLGNEKPRAKRLDAWIACSAGPNVEFSGVPAGHLSNHPAGGTSAATQG